MSTPKWCTSWWGHKFEARYSYEPGRSLSANELFWTPYEQRRAAILATQKRTYEGDVCIRCGCVVNRREAE
jgi:hypothetical protein